MAAKKTRVLGKGLDALFMDSRLNEEIPVEEDNVAIEDEKTAENTVNFIEINQLRPNASQPRKNFDEEKISDLAESINLHGVIQPIIARPIENGFEIVAGERRWRAARKAGLKSVPCIIKSLSDRENMLIAIIENMQREDLNPIEEAMALREMVSQYGLTQDEISKSVGKSRPYITNALRLLKLPDSVRQMVSEGRLSGGHARALAGIENEETQIALAKKACDGKLSVHALENLISSSSSKSSKKKNTYVKSPELIKLENEFKEIFGTKVNIPIKNNKGKIEIEFYSYEELNRIYDLLKSLEIDS